MKLRSEQSIADLRDSFPLLKSRAYGRHLVYLDNAATTQKPHQVLASMDHYYQETNANVHRGIHLLSQRATEAFEDARQTVADFIGAADSRQVIFTRGTTEGINLVAAGFRKVILHAGDEVLVSEMEHHSNIVPWQMACEEKGSVLKVIPMNDRGELQLDKLDELLTDRVKIVALTWVSNALGTVNPVKEVIREAHRKGIPVLIDAAQAVAHFPVNVMDLDADFLVFSGHKLYGPTGIGILYGKKEWMELLPPYQGGGEMISRVTFQKTTYNVLPYKFEAGTPDIAGAIGLGAAIEFLKKAGLSGIRDYEHQLYTYARKRLSQVPGIRFIGTAAEQTGVISFLIDGFHPLDIGELLDKQGIAVRTGAHCAAPVMDHFGIEGTVRASFALYNSFEDVEALYDGLIKAVSILQ